MANSTEERQSAECTFKIEEHWPPRRHGPQKDTDDQAFQRWIERARAIYDSGTPLFPRDSILDVARQLESDPLPAVITLRQWDGTVDEIATTYPTRKMLGRIGLLFNNFENMIKSKYLCPPQSFRGGSLSISWSRSDKSFAPLLSTSDLIEAYEAQEKLWLQSLVFQVIQKHLVESVTRAPSKIIGIGLGSATHRESNMDQIFHQHAAVKTIANAFHERFGTNVVTYCQDPDYHRPDLQLLEHIGVQHIKSPHGFLATDRDSIVVSVSPDCPTKQIVADNPQYWPMAMIWDKVQTPEEELELYAPMDPVTLVSVSRYMKLSLLWAMPNASARGLPELVGLTRAGTVFGKWSSIIIELCFLEERLIQTEGLELYVRKDCV